MAEFELKYSENLKYFKEIKENRKERYQKSLDFIANNFQVRECVKFRGKSGSDNGRRDNGECDNSKDICECHRSREAHVNRGDTEEEWTYERNTETIPCSPVCVYTEDNEWIRALTFDCVDNRDSTCDKLIALLTDRDKLNVPLPRLIISLIGGSDKVNHFSDQEKKNFKQGLRDVIKKNNTWLLVEGFNLDIYLLVRDTVHEFRLLHEDLKDQVTLLGIISRGTFNMKPELSNLYFQESKAEFEFLYDYLLICDDGTMKPHDKVAEFRLKLEYSVKEKANSSLVHILFDGDRRTITDSLTALKDQVPLVVIEGSGGAADVISEVMKLPNKDKNDSVASEAVVRGSVVSDVAVSDSVASEAVVRGSVVSDAAVSDAVVSDAFVSDEERIRTIATKNTSLLGNQDDRDTESEITKCLIVVSDMRDASVKLEQEIFVAIISGAGEGLEEILECCVRLNCADIAMTSVFSDPNYVHMTKEQIEPMFIDSLKENKPEFVDLFLANSFHVEEISDKHLLRDLYKVSLNPSERIYGYLVKDLADDTNSSFGWKIKNGKFKHDILLRAGRVIEKLSEKILNNRYGDKVSTGTSTDPKEKEKEEGPDSIKILTAEDLFLWALLSGRIPLSLVLWKRCKYHIGSALIAALILQKMASLVLMRGDNTLQLKFIEASQKYQKLAISIVTQSYKINQWKTYKPIVRQLREYNNLTCIDIAIDGEMKGFLNHSACRSLTTELWMGNLSSTLPTWKIIVCIPFGLFLMRPLIMPSFPTYSELEIRTNEAERDKKPLLIAQEKLKFTGISILKATKIFYRAPIVKFFIHLFSYILFLLVFSYMNLVELKPGEEVRYLKNMPAEIIVWIFVISFIIEECRQILVQKRPGYIPKLRKHLSDIWNKLDVFIILIYNVGVVTRFVIPKENFTICRCFYSVTLSMFFLRSMQFYFVNSSIGPKVIMIQHMLLDILFFLGIFVIFIMSYGTLAQALRFPNSKFELALFKDIVYMPYFQTYGELMLDTLEVAAPCNGTDCVVKSAVVVIGFGIFLLLTNVLLINLLIAMFGYTFNKIQADSENKLYYKRMQLVLEYLDKPIWTAPLNILYYFYEKISSIRTVLRPPQQSDQENDIYRKNMDNYQLDTFERYSMETALIENREQTGCEFTEKESRSQCQCSVGPNRETN